jgi:MFS family permease
LPIWIARLPSTERAALIATYCGWMLDGMDVMVYSFVLPTLITIWGLTKSQAGLLGTSVLLISSLGGWLAGLAADRFGRVIVLQTTIAWFAFFTFLSGFTNSFPQLLVTRGLQGLGFGGEWAVGSVLIGETIQAKFRGRAVGLVQSGWAIGWAIAAGCYSVFYLFLPVEIAWRAMFWVGILPALLVLYIRQRVPEPRVYQDLQPTKGKPANSGFLQIFAPRLLRTTALASLVATGAQGGYYAITTWLPLYLKTVRGFSVLNTTGYLAVVILGSFAGYITAAQLTDWIGRRMTLILFAICSLLAVCAYTLLSFQNYSTLLLGFPLGFFSSGLFSPMGSFFTELFPTVLRGSGQGFCYNIGRGIGALFPALVGCLSTHIPLAHAIAWFAIAAYAMVVLGVMGLPETTGKDLRNEL